MTNLICSPLLSLFVSPLQKLKVHKSALKKIQQDVEWLKGSNQRDELFGGARKGMCLPSECFFSFIFFLSFFSAFLFHSQCSKTIIPYHNLSHATSRGSSLLLPPLYHLSPRLPPSTSASIDGPNLDTPDQVMAHGRKIQKESIDALGRTVGVVAETKQIATETAVKVQSQTEQIENMYQDLYQIDDILVRTRKIMKRMMRRTLSNRYLWYLIFLIVVGIIVIIVLETTGGSDTKKEEDQV